VELTEWLIRRKYEMKKIVKRTRNVSFYPLIWVSHFVAPSPNDTPHTIYNEVVAIYEILRLEYNDPHNRWLEFIINSGD
jgi:hypothetical protein